MNRTEWGTQIFYTLGIRLVKCSRKYVFFVFSSISTIFKTVELDQYLTDYNKYWLKRWSVNRGFQQCATYLI